MKLVDVSNLLDFARSYLIGRYSFLTHQNFYFDEFHSIYEGATSIDDYGCLNYVYVGISDFNDLSLDDDVSDFDFMVPLVGMFHEVCGHCNQFYGQFQINNNLSQVLVVNYFACKCSAGYYGLPCLGKDDSSNNYYNHVHEIAAQYAGIKSCFAFCDAYFGRDKAQRLICSYVNERIRRDSEFINFRNNKEYDCVDDILDEFNIVFKKQVHARKIFDPRVLINHNDTVADYTHVNNWNYDLIDVQRNHDGLKQDIMLTSIYLYCEDKNDYLKEKLFALQDIPFGDYPPYVNRKILRRSLHLNVKDLDLSELVDCQMIDAEFHDGFG